MTITVRRYERHGMAAPASIRAGRHTLAATTKDISRGGLFMVTDTALREGTEIEVVLMLPKELGLPTSGMVCCRGKIVRTETAPGKYGIAVTIERYEVVPQARNFGG